MGEWFSDPWYVYAVILFVGVLIGIATGFAIIARDGSVVSLQEGMVVTTRDFMDGLQEEIKDLKERIRSV